MLEVKINVVREGATLPEYHTEGAAGFDLAICEDTLVRPGETVKAPLGLVIQAPEDHFLFIVPRSSTAKKWGVSLGNTVGIVDRDFCGPEDELALMLHRDATSDIFGHRMTFQSMDVIPAGTRLAQGLFIPVTQALFVPQDEPIASTRGGWGSTG